MKWTCKRRRRKPGPRPSSVVCPVCASPIKRSCTDAPKGPGNPIKAHEERREKAYREAGVTIPPSRKAKKVTMGIKDWRYHLPKRFATFPKAPKCLQNFGGVSGPIGDPSMANTAYMLVFVALERDALSRLTDEELAVWANQTLYSVCADAKAEQARRERL